MRTVPWRPCGHDSPPKRSSLICDQCRQIASFLFLSRGVLANGLFPPFSSLNLTARPNSGSLHSERFPAFSDPFVTTLFCQLGCQSSWPSGILVTFVFVLQTSGECRFGLRERPVGAEGELGSEQESSRSLGGRERRSLLPGPVYRAPHLQATLIRLPPGFSSLHCRTHRSVQQETWSLPWFQDMGGCVLLVADCVRVGLLSHKEGFFSPMLKTKTGQWDGRGTSETATIRYPTSSHDACVAPLHAHKTGPARAPTGFSRPDVCHRCLYNIWCHDSYAFIYGINFLVIGASPQV